jgi:hypothetical protein
LYISEETFNTLKDVSGFMYLYCGPSPDDKNFLGLAAYYLKKAEYFSEGESGGEGVQLCLDADHRVYACFFPRHKTTGKLTCRGQMIRLKGRAAEEALRGFDERMRANNK